MTFSRRSLLAGGAGLALPGAVIGTARAQRPAPLRFVPSTPLPALDPIVATSYVIRNHGYLVYDTLFATDETYRVRPQMVANWETAADGLAWTFALRDRLVFHDGAPVTSADCIASIRRWSARDAFGQTMAASVEGYEAKDARTFTIRLKRPFPLMLEALGKLSSNVPFIMPERIAATDPSRPITEAIGSGPWRFLPGEWNPGQRAAYERFAQYVPRDEAPSWAAGGKIAKIDRIEWLGITEAPAAAGAMRQGEIDWWEQPPVDLLPVLKRDRNIEILNVPLGFKLLMRFNHLQAPFNNPAIRRAVMMAVNQDDYMQAVAGSPEYYAACKSFFTCGTPLASDVGSAAVGANVERARQMLREAGYANEKVVLLAPADQPIAYNQAQVSENLLKRLGMNVDFITTDWASFVSRRNNRGPVDQGGWSAFHTLWSGADLTNPAINPLIRANGTAAWLGWPDDPTLEGLRDQWLATSDAAAQLRIAKEMQERAFETVPFVPTGSVEQPMAYRKALTGMIVSPVQFFWNMEKR
ncbi:ABC transporter substrate-binding protein [Neoroseomonas oryzicola]|uniref:ABC transporter substrate-binding protein n=1 Tax=Neoroseomonas oryzicola TaxID=535904 RepID=A0A9X9WN76_9PROT|nr:ABC transporter substrate-binding protein [Neoroseomonas oryzicola]MBR0661786.1 ABC transporter substrate-binding protein [Neoroseomonas oryzicola]NKE17960.1 ABC transporter substrate-binding protein [Neoroseomonas oryzicola]